MGTYDFIFSERFFNRFLRHILFWVSWFTYYLVTYLLTPWSVWLYQNHPSVLQEFRFTPYHADLLRATFFNVSRHVIVFYIFYQFFFLKGSLMKKILMVVAGLFVAIIIDSLLWIVSPELKLIFRTSNSIFRQTLSPVMLRSEIIRDLAYNIPTLFGLAAMIKFGKHWYQKQKERELLIKEKLQAELQLLKAQIHPHFLFNTLNNIYSFILTSNPNASGLILKLSNLLRYILNECNQPKVPLVKELKMIENYMELEKIRYGERLNMQVTIIGNPENKSVAPLLLLPFIENSFKHGASNVLQNPWINLRLVITDQDLSMELVNGQAAATQAYDKNGIGLTNVQKRLNLLYGNQHTLKIEAEQEVFKIQLTVKLEKNAVNSEEVVEATYLSESTV